MVQFIITIGSTETAKIDGISAAGATPALMVHTPRADAEIVTYGSLAGAPVVPVSPAGCPTPAVITRAVKERLRFETVIVDAGAAKESDAPAVSMPSGPGEDIRGSVAVPRAQPVFERSKELGAAIPDDELFIGETIPGGTTTAMGVLAVLGEESTVSSSLADNPVSLKRDTVRSGLDASGIEPGGLSGRPVEAVRRMGDPVLATVSGMTVGATQAGKSVTLCGGTQMSAAAQLVRHTGCNEAISQATTTFVANDETTGIQRMADAASVDLTVTDPCFNEKDHPAMQAFVRGEAKEGVGMGGALALLNRSHDVSSVHTYIEDVYERLIAEKPR